MEYVMDFVPQKISKHLEALRPPVNPILLPFQSLVGPPNNGRLKVELSQPDAEVPTAQREYNIMNPGHPSLSLKRYHMLPTANQLRIRRVVALHCKVIHCRPQYEQFGLFLYIRSP